MAYTTDLTVPQFELLDQLLPQSKTRGYAISRHLIVNAILYQLKNGCQWRDLPADFPNRLIFPTGARFTRNFDVGSLTGHGQRCCASWRSASVKLSKKRNTELADRRLDVRQEYGHGQSGNQRLLLVQGDQRH